MTVITVNTPAGRISAAQRRILAESLTDAVLEPELGQLAPAARIGFQVHFTERTADSMAIGGRLLSDQDPAPDIMVVDIAVMDANWPADARRRVIERMLEALADALEADRPSAAWWVNFRVIEEGSWGSRGGVLSILDLLGGGVFTEARIAEIRSAIGGSA